MSKYRIIIKFKDYVNNKDFNNILKGISEIIQEKVLGIFKEESLIQEIEFESNQEKEAKNIEKMITSYFFDNINCMVLSEIKDIKIN